MCFPALDNEVQIRPLNSETEAEDATDICSLEKDVSLNSIKFKYLLEQQHVLLLRRVPAMDISSAGIMIPTPGVARSSSSGAATATETTLPLKTSASTSAWTGSLAVSTRA